MLFLILIPGATLQGRPVIFLGPSKLDLPKEGWHSWKVQSWNLTPGTRTSSPHHP